MSNKPDPRKVAELQAAAIMAYWRGRRRQVSAWPEPRVVEIGGKSVTVWAIVSDLVNGKPRDAAA